MSQHFKINSTLLAIIASALGAWGSVVWIASSKANDIETHGTDILSVKQEIKALQDADRSTHALLQRLDERTSMVLENLRSITSMLESIRKNSN